MTLSLARRPPVRDMSILDQYGKPIEVRVRQVAAANPRGTQTYTSHPEIGLTVENLLHYQRQGEEGNPIRQNDMWDGLLERHGECQGMFHQRRETVAACEFRIMPGRDDKPSRIAAEALQESLKYNVKAAIESQTTTSDTCFRKWIEHQLTCVERGYAATNLVWDYEEKLLIPTRYAAIAHRRFGAPRADQADQIWLLDASNMSWQELQPGCWSVSRYYHRNPYMAGLMRSCSWWIYFALTGFKQWQIFGDMFGMPMAIGYYEEGAGQASREALEEAVRAIGQDGYAVLSAMTELIISQTARGGDSSTVYPQIMKACNQMLTKLITGGTLNTDVSSTGAGSYNAAKVHEGREFRMMQHDASIVEEVFADTIGKPFVMWNGFDRSAIPRMHIRIERGSLDRAKQLQIIGAGMKLSKSQIQEEFALSEPTSPDDEVQFEPPAPDPMTGGAS